MKAFCCWSTICLVASTFFYFLPDCYQLTIVILLLVM
uniref:Uncharacterized protein n=1 Tax=Arundo donax TaxID=35708 RepID=A0A0A9BXQ0_ARUDO